MQSDGDGGAVADELPPKIEIQDRVTVMPATPSSDQLFLTPLDIFWQDHPYGKWVLFYDTHSAADVKDPVQILSRGLSEALHYYYPWSRRINTGNDGRLFINSNDNGVEIVSAVIDFPIGHLVADGYQMRPWFEQLCQAVAARPGSLHLSPLLVVQVTRFSDGGLAVGVTNSNVVADGQSLWNFLVTWGECAREMEPSKEPMHNRRRLSLMVPPSEEKAKEFTIHPEIRPEDYDGLVEDEYASVDTAADTGGNTEPAGVVQCVFDLSGENITNLKIEAGIGFTNFEVLCAYMWQRITAARNLPAKTPISLSLLASCRTFITPPLPANYFGNAVALCPTGSTAGKICNESIRETCVRVHEVLAKAGRTTEALSHWLELRGNRLVPFFKPAYQRSMVVIGSPRFPTYDVDFGWEAPSAVRSCTAPDDGEVVVFGGRPGSWPGDVELTIALPAPELRRLLDDRSFLATARSEPYFGKSFSAVAL